MVIFDTEQVPNHGGIISDLCSDLPNQWTYFLKLAIVSDRNQGRNCSDLLLFINPLCLHLCCSRQEFGLDQCPDLTREVYLQDIHCVGSLCKLYFRELPNPLLTYELYKKFTVRHFLPCTELVQFWTHFI